MQANIFFKKGVFILDIYPPMNYNERIDIEERKNKSKFSLIVSGEKERGKAERVSPPKRKVVRLRWAYGRIPV